ncbi:uncharacterized protein DEA37_0001329 [Paragonimus westermani]|uniref:Uncharacterized protein n=1 Tax=Paragonimus westermani TaxID=34504 RepID=A0A5J4NDP2_9TREM|nr:uncharacterized protein DEA37_0001329 [Paragonimus westermani]
MSNTDAFDLYWLSDLGNESVLGSSEATPGSQRHQPVALDLENPSPGPVARSTQRSKEGIPDTSRPIITPIVSPVYMHSIFPKDQKVTTSYTLFDVVTSGDCPSVNLMKPDSNKNVVGHEDSLSTAPLNLISRECDAVQGTQSLIQLSTSKDNSYLEVTTKPCVYRSMVLSILLFGSEMWTLYQRNASYLSRFNVQCLRRILRGLKHATII